jgi:hypothetical protein
MPRNHWYVYFEGSSWPREKCWFPLTWHNQNNCCGLHYQQLGIIHYLERGMGECSWCTKRLHNSYKCVCVHMWKGVLTYLKLKVYKTTIDLYFIYEIGTCFEWLEKPPSGSITIVKNPFLFYTYLFQKPIQKDVVKKALGNYQLLSTIQGKDSTYKDVEFTIRRFAWRYLRLFLIYWSQTYFPLLIFTMMIHIHFLD